jgi:2-iminobutanoate/2-iminopropanoate deaminase
MREALTSPTLPKPRFRYSHCVRIGNTYQVSGMIALDAATGTLATGGPGAETRKILANLVAALPDFGLSLDDMLVARIFTTRFDAFAEINAAWDELFSCDAPPPARMSAGVSALPLGATVEIEFSFQKDATSGQKDRTDG